MASGFFSTGLSQLLEVPPPFCKLNNDYYDARPSLSEKQRSPSKFLVVCLVSGPVTRKVETRNETRTFYREAGSTALYVPCFSGDVVNSWCRASVL